MRKRGFDPRKSRPKFRSESRGERGRNDRDPRHGERAEAAAPAGGRPERPWQRDKAQERHSKAKPWRAPPRDRDGPVILYGWHSVRAALENPARRFHRLLATENVVHRLAETGLTLPVAPTLARPEEIAALAGPEAVHQGIVAEADPLEAPTLEDLAPKHLVLVLDQITDPHNAGAILRTAAAFEVAAVVMQDRHSPPESGVLAKAASGALDIVPVIYVVNIARTLDQLGKLDFWRITLAGDGESPLREAMPVGDVAFVLGSEGDGVRRLVREHCDTAAYVPIDAAMESLNVSNAAAVVLYEARRG